MKNLRIQETFDASVLEAPYVVLDGNDVVHYGQLSDQQGTNTQPDTEIWYTTSDGKIYSVGGEEVGMQTSIGWYTDPEAFDGNGTYGGPNIIEEVFEDGVWKIKFDAPVTHLGFSVEWDDLELGPFTIYPNFCAGEVGNNVKTISLPSSVTVIDKSSFMACVELEEINIPNGVTNIDDKSFLFVGTEDKLTSLTIPTSVTHLGGYIFAESWITELYYAGTKAQFMAINKDVNWYKSGSSSEPIGITAVHCSDGDITGEAITVNPTFNTDDPQYDTFDELFK